METVRKIKIRNSLYFNTASLRCLKDFLNCNFIYSSVKRKWQVNLKWIYLPILLLALGHYWSAYAQSKMCLVQYEARNSVFGTGILDIRPEIYVYNAYFKIIMCYAVNNTYLSNGLDVILILLYSENFCCAQYIQWRFRVTRNAEHHGNR